MPKLINTEAFMNIPAIHTNVRRLPAHAFHSDVEPMSRVEKRLDASLLTMSYPQRIKMMIARAPSPPPLRRTPVAAQQPMSEETRAMLLYVHTAAATAGTPTTPQIH